MDNDRKRILSSAYMMMGLLGGFIAATILTVAWTVWLAYYFEGEASSLFWRFVIMGNQLILVTSLITGMIAGRILFSRRVEKPGHEGR